MESDMMAENFVFDDSEASFEQSISEMAWSSVDAESQTNIGSRSEKTETASLKPKEFRYDLDIYNRTLREKQKQSDDTKKIPSQFDREEEFSSASSESASIEFVGLQEFSDEAMRLFDSIDSDKNGYLSTSELAEAVEKRYSGRDAQVIAGLYVARSQLSDLSNDEFGVEDDGITRGDLNAFAQLQTDESANNLSDVSRKVDFALRRTYSAQQSGVEHLYIDPLNAVYSITSDSINQGRMGDCYFLATIAAIAATQPELIESMIRDGGDGTYTVTFPGDLSNPVTIKAPTEAELGIYNKPNADGIWASVLEKAYGKYCRENLFNRSILNLDGGNTTSEGADGGELLHGKVLNFLTGRETDTDFIILSSTETIRQKLIDAFSKGHAVTAGIANIYFTDRSAGGLPDAHNYAILDFDPDGNNGGIVTVFNPWGGRNRTIELDLDEFMDNFSTITFSNG